MDLLARLSAEHLAMFTLSVHLIGEFGELSGNGYSRQLVIGKATSEGIEYPDMVFKFEGAAGRVKKIEYRLNDDLLEAESVDYVINGPGDKIAVKASIRG
jgi:hypothetical protein